MDSFRHGVSTNSTRRKGGNDAGIWVHSTRRIDAVCLTYFKGRATEFNYNLCIFAP